MVIRGPFMAIRVKKEKMSHFCFFPFLTLKLLALFTTSAHLFCASTSTTTRFDASRCLRHSARLGFAMKFSSAAAAAALASSRAIESKICFMLFQQFGIIVDVADNSEVHICIKRVESEIVITCP